MAVRPGWRGRFLCAGQVDVFPEPDAPFGAGS